MSFTRLLDEIDERLRQLLSDLDYPEVSYKVEPAKPGFGDASCNVAFLLAKPVKRRPSEIAELLAARYKDGRLVERAEAHPSGYLNFFARREALYRQIICASTDKEYGRVDLGGGADIVVEHTSVNPNKALHIGHVRNIVIGDCIARILGSANFAVKVLNYVDDSGLQVADIVLGFRHLGFDPEPPRGQKFDRYCGDTVYVQTSARYAQQPDLEGLRREILKEIEEGTSETARLAGSITKRVLACQLETCWSLSVRYDCLNFESHILRSGLWGQIFQRLKERRLVRHETEGKNAGCWVIGGADGDDDKVLVRSNDTATYIAKDIPYAAWKLGLVADPFGYTRYEPEQPGGRVLWQTTLDGGEQAKFAGRRAITVIDSRQSRLQDIIASLMSQFSPDPDAYVHLKYESVTLSPETAKTLGIDAGGKQVQMSGRKGLYVNADSVLALLKERVRQETKTRNPDIGDEQLDRIADDVAVGTLRYEMVKQDLNKVIVFDLTKALSLEGDTAPYIQYTYARASRILERSKTRPDYNAEYGLLDSDYERDLVQKIGTLDIQIVDAANNLSPKVLARYCYDMAIAFNAFYEHVKVLDADAARTNVRLCLVESFQTTLKTALELLGIGAPYRM